jgi:hypothetical protein
MNSLSLDAEWDINSDEEDVAVTAAKPLEKLAITTSPPTLRRTATDSLWNLFSGPRKEPAHHAKKQSLSSSRPVPDSVSSWVHVPAVDPLEEAPRATMTRDEMLASLKATASDILKGPPNWLA